MTSLSVKESYAAMFAFLEEYYNRTKSDEIGILLGGLSTLPDGMPADPGYWQDWLNAVRRVQLHGTDIGLNLDRSK